MKKNKKFEMFGFTLNVQDDGRDKIVAYKNTLVYRLHPFMWDWDMLQLRDYLLGRFEYFGIGKDYLIKFINEKIENNYK